MLEKPRLRWIVIGIVVLSAAGALWFRTEQGFLSSLVATFIGAALGFFIALYVDRIQRAEDREREQKAKEAKVAEDEVIRLTFERDRRVTVMRLLREELAPMPRKFGIRQERNIILPATDRLSDTLWCALSASGEIHWISDLDLLRKVASAYELVGVEADLEDGLRRAQIDGGMAGVPIASRAYSDQLKSLDRDAWRLVCDACKALDAALVLDDEAPGSNADSLFCPY